MSQAELESLVAGLRERGRKWFIRRRAAEGRLLGRQGRGELVWNGSRGRCYHAHMAKWRIEHDEQYRPRQGVCSWCGCETEGRKQWHQECVDEFKIIHWWPSTVAWLERYRWKGAKCAECGEHPVEWDHVRPLAEAGEDVTAHFIDNIQPLCVTCHKAKTKQQAARRRVCRRSDSLFSDKE